MIVLVCIVSFNSAWGGWGLSVQTEYHLVRSVAQCTSIAETKRSGAGHVQPHHGERNLENTCGPALADCRDSREVKQGDRP